MRKITAAQEAEIKQRYADGEPASVMALEHGITVSRVRQLCPVRTPGRGGRQKRSEERSAYRPGDDCQTCGGPASECGHVRPETPDR